MTGLHLAQYHIDAELGRGGMGIVYRATDSKLDRTVALKVLPVSALAVEDDRARFYREAKAAAQLHHPNIASVFQIDEAVPHASGEDPQPGAEKRLFIAMEYVDGESLDARVRRGPLALAEAVSIASQVAQALKVAHAKDIVHRDIKSPNIMLTAAGDAKVLDFGLAKTAASTKLTRQGSTLGTIAYMSPEQARGEEVDRRTDLWALGVVLHEMICGRLPFEADYEQATLYAILNEDPEPLTALRTGVPMELERITNKLLAKDRARRYASAEDLIVDLRALNLAEASRSSIRVSQAQVESASAPVRNSRRFAVGVLTGAVVSSLAWLIWFVWPGTPERDTTPAIQLSLILNSREPPAHIAISPDGTKLAYVDDRVFVMDLESGTEVALEGTENTSMTEFSPDGTQLLLTKSVSIERMPVLGGTPLTVVETMEGVPRAVWGPGDWIVYEDEQALFRYSESTGQRILISRPDSVSGEIDYDWPRLMPDGRTIAVTLESEESPPQVRFLDFETGETRATVNFAAYGVRWLPTGHLVGTVGNAGLVIVPFDPDRLEITGSRRAVAPVASPYQYTVSSGGALVYSEEDPLGDLTTVRSIPSVITFPEFREQLPIPPGFYSDFRLSPDESRVAYVRHGGDGTGSRQRSLWIYDFATRDSRQLVSNSLVHYPAWTPDGDSLLFLRAEAIGQAADIFVRAADGSGGERTVSFLRGVGTYLDVSPDRSSMVLVSASGPGVGVLRRLDLLTGGRPVIAGEEGTLAINDPRISPDGQWVAYQEDENVMIRRLDGTGIPLNMTRGFGEYPRWVRHGDGFQTVTYLGAVFDYDVSGGPAGGRSMYRQIAELGSLVPYYEPFDDGERAIVADAIDAAMTGDSLRISRYSLHFVVNWLDGLRD